MKYKIGSKPESYITDEIVNATCDKLKEKYGNVAEYMSEQGLDIVTSNESLAAFIMTFVLATDEDSSTIAQLKQEAATAFLTAALVIELIRTAIGGLEMEVMMDDVKPQHE